MSAPETLSTMCLAANLPGRTQFNLPASNVRGSCYDELDVARIEQTDPFDCPDAGTLLQHAGADSGGIAITHTNAREREAVVWGARRVD
jgi:hypothetical protein